MKKKLILKGELGDKYSEDRRNYLKFIKDRRKLKSIIPNPKYIKIEYVRYADDWLMGVWESKSVAVELRSLIDNFLKELKLELSLEKTFITNARKGRAKFLGTFIKRSSSTKATFFTKSKLGRKS